MFTGEMKHSTALISKAERHLAQMTLQIAQLPPEAAGTQLELLSHEVIKVMECKLRRLYDQHCRLLEEGQVAGTAKVAL